MSKDLRDPLQIEFILGLSDFSKISCLVITVWCVRYLDVRLDRLWTNYQMVAENGFCVFNMFLSLCVVVQCLCRIFHVQLLKMHMWDSLAGMSWWDWAPVSHAAHRTLKDAGEALMKFSSPGSHILYKSSTGEERCICLRYMDYFISASFLWPL